MFWKVCRAAARCEYGGACSGIDLLPVHFELEFAFKDVPPLIPIVRAASALEFERTGVSIDGTVRRYS